MEFSILALVYFGRVFFSSKGLNLVINHNYFFPFRLIVAHLAGFSLKDSFLFKKRFHLITICNLVFAFSMILMLHFIVLVIVTCLIRKILPFTNKGSILVMILSCF